MLLLFSTLQSFFLYFLLVKQERTEKPLAAVDNKKLYGSSMKYLTKRMLERTTGRSNEQTEQENEKQNKVCAKELVIGPRSNLGFVSIFGFPDSLPDSVTPQLILKKIVGLF